MKHLYASAVHPTNVTTQGWHNHCTSGRYLYIRL